jgi:hypothetical protein
MHWLLSEGSATMTEISIYGQTVWDLLTLEDADDAELSPLSEVMVLLGDAPPDFIGELSPHHKDIVTRGRQVRMQLPSYLEQQRALFHAHCPLPVVLQPLVAAYAAPNLGQYLDGRVARLGRRMLDPKLPWCGATALHGVSAGAILRAAVPAGPLEGAQGRMQAVVRGGQGAQDEPGSKRNTS